MKPLARLVGYGVAGVEPTIMGIGPVNAIEKLLKVTGVKMSDIGMVEVCLFFKKTFSLGSCFVYSFKESFFLYIIEGLKSLK